MIGSLEVHCLLCLLLSGAPIRGLANRLERNILVI